MTRKSTFVGIVAKSGDKDAKWSGLFKYSKLKGYTGSILSTSSQPEHGKHIFALPKELDNEVLYCILDGSQFGTIVWPALRGVQIKNFVAQIRGLEIRNLIRGVHIGAQERDIKIVQFDSPILAQIFGLKAFKEEIEPHPSRKISIESIAQDDTEFSTSLGKLAIGIGGFYSPSGSAPAPSLNAKSYIKIHASPPNTPVEAIKSVRRLEHLLSLLTFDFIKASNIRLSINTRNPEGEVSEQSFGMDRAKITKSARTKFEWHEIPLHISDHKFASLLDRFLDVFEDIEQTLNWYRIVTTEKRYLEDKFFYSVRMIEAVHKTLKVEISTDTSASKELSTIIAKLEKLGNNETSIEFLKKRAAPIFSRASLTEILIDIKKKYADMRAVEILDHKIINRLRGKEAHGSTQPFSAQDYQFMSYSYEILRVVYVFVVLEYCGLSRDFMLESLRTSVNFRRLFSEDTLQQYRDALGAK